MKKKKTVLIGLTGSFGSGKSTVAGVFEKLGAAVIDVDQLAHEAYAKGTPTAAKIKALFQKEPVLTRGKLDRRKIADVVFKEPRLLKKLESIIHPYVFEKIGIALGKVKKEVVVVNIPLLFETGFEKMCTATIVVKAKTEVVLKRLKKRGFSEKDLRARLKHQMPMAQKIKKANFVIDNSGSILRTQKDIKQIWTDLRSCL